MVTRKTDVARKILYQKYKQAKEQEQEEVVYSEYDGYEIITTHIYNKGFETWKSFGRCGLEVLEKYNNKIDAVAGHAKWCMMEGVC